MLLNYISALQLQQIEKAFSVIIPIITGENTSGLYLDNAYLRFNILQKLNKNHCFLTFSFELIVPTITYLA